MARRVFLAVEAAGLARVDFFVSQDDDEHIYVNEINTMPGFTPISMYPKLWEASGVSYAQLIDRLIQLALERHEDRQDTTTDKGRAHR
jgi:D-alanine-D-alanine ligase